MSDTADRMQDAARAVAVALPPGTGFIVLAFDLNTDTGRLEYVSNAERADVVMAMREFIRKTEAGFAEHLPPDADVPKDQLVERCWRIYLSRHPHAKAEHFRHAFFNGAKAFKGLLHAAAKREFSEEQGVAFFQALHDELAREL